MLPSNERIVQTNLALKEAVEKTEEMSNRSPKKRINLHVSQEMYGKVLEESEYLSISMTGVVNVALSQYFAQKESVNAMGLVEQMIELSKE